MAKRKFSINLPTKIILLSSAILTSFAVYRFSFENYVSLRKREKSEREANILYEKQIEASLSRVKSNENICTTIRM